MKDLIAYGLAYIAPMAPLTTFGFVWDASGGLIALAYLLGAICMYFTAQSYATMSATVPCSGSVYGFARHSLGELPGFIAGWLILLDYLLIPALVFLVMAVGLQTLLPNLDRATSLAGLVVISLAVNWLGVAVTTRVSLVSVVVQFWSCSPWWPWRCTRWPTARCGRADRRAFLRCHPLRPDEDIHRHLDLRTIVPGLRCHLDAIRRGQER